MNTNITTHSPRRAVTGARTLQQLSLKVKPGAQIIKHSALEVMWATCHIHPLKWCQSYGNFNTYHRKQHQRHDPLQQINTEVASSHCTGSSIRDINTTTPNFRVGVRGINIAICHQGDVRDPNRTTCSPRIGISALNNAAPNPGSGIRAWTSQHIEIECVPGANTHTHRVLSVLSRANKPTCTHWVMEAVAEASTLQPN